MKLNNAVKNTIILIVCVFSVLLGTLVWPHIFINVSNITGAEGQITKQNYSTDSDTLRYIIFISLPLLTFLISSIVLKSKQIINIKKILFYDIDSVQKTYNTLNYPFLLFFIIFLFFEFASLNLPLSLVDTFHDGELLSSAKNALINKNLFISTYTIHGASDILYPIFFWKIFGIESIGAGRSFFYFINLMLKISSVFLVYQLTRLVDIDIKLKKIFFLLFTILILSMSQYQAPINFSYFSYRDIFIILFLIFFLEIFLDAKFKKISHILISLITILSFFLHIDTGVFLHVLLLSYLIFLIINKKNYYVVLLSFSYVVFWIIILLFIGYDEIWSFLQNAFTIILSMDYLHGIMYPEPFFSIGKNPDGARATRGLLLQVIAGLFVLHNLLHYKNKKNINERIFFIFLFFLSFIMYKNALGRSDSYHIRMSNDLPILIISYFSLKYLMEKIYIDFLTNKLILPIIILAFLIFNIKNINLEKIINIKENYRNFIGLEDKFFVKKEVVKFIKDFKKLSQNDNCVVNFTDDLILPYLIKKPSCSKFILTWLASPVKNQQVYVQDLKNKKPKYIIYDSPEYKVDGINSSERLAIVNKFILQNYSFYKEIEKYKIYILNN